MKLEPKFCEQCGRTFLREIGSSDVYCQHHEKPAQMNEDTAVWEFKLMMEALMSEK